MALGIVKREWSKTSIENWCDYKNFAGSEFEAGYPSREIFVALSEMSGIRQVRYEQKLS